MSRIIGIWMCNSPSDLAQLNSVLCVLSPRPPNEKSCLVARKWFNRCYSWDSISTRNSQWKAWRIHTSPYRTLFKRKEGQRDVQTTKQITAMCKEIKDKLRALQILVSCNERHRKPSYGNTMSRSCGTSRGNCRTECMGASSQAVSRFRYLP